MCMFATRKRGATLHELRAKPPTGKVRRSDVLRPQLPTAMHPGSALSALRYRFCAMMDSILLNTNERLSLHAQMFLHCRFHRHSNRYNWLRLRTNESSFLARSNGVAGSGRVSLLVECLQA